jgi:sterol desaturase/sphingolipid hydroxylase (fatty acid hydroxylase superfamily)
LGSRPNDTLGPIWCTSLPDLPDLQDLLPFVISVARQCTWLVLLSVIFVPLERLFAVRPQKFFRKALAQDVGYYFISGLVPSLLLAVPLSLAAVAAHHLVPYRLQVAVAARPLWQRILAGLVVGEVGFYWGHRWTHQIPFLWRFHSIHHSAEHVYFLVSSRAHPIDNVFIRLCGLIPAYLLGVASPLTPTGSLVPVLIVLVATMWGFFIHSNLRCRLGPLEWLVATPAFHHWHHTLREPLDRNFASMLPCMDRIFGTFYLPKQWPSAYGTETKVPASLGGQLVYPLLPQPPQASSSDPAAVGAYGQGHSANSELRSRGKSQG